MIVELNPYQKGWATRRRKGWKHPGHSEEAKRKMRGNLLRRWVDKEWSEAERARRKIVGISEEHKQKLRDRVVSEKTKKKMSESHKGKILSEEHKQGIRESIIAYYEIHPGPWAGKSRGPQSEETKQKVSGPNNYRWKEDRSLVDLGDLPEYKIWRTSVFERDHYTCQECGQVGGQLEAHHIKSREEYPELIYDVDNGRTLCILHHAEKHPERYALIMSRAA